MSSSMFVVGVTLKAFDQMSGVLGNATKNLSGVQKKIDGIRASAEKLGRAGLADGLIVGAGLQKSISAFAELEDASVRLKSTMMDKNGVTGAFDQVNALAVELGNRLPGTSADFINMMAALKQQGIGDQSILGGVGEAAANLAVLLKMPADAAAVFAAKMKKATGTVDADMLGLMDTIQRTYFLGVKADEMMFAFARSGGALKNFGIQGLEQAKALAPIFAQLTGGGMSGETVGTGFATILSSMADGKKMREVNGYLSKMGITLKFFENGKFVGPKQMVAELDKLRKLDPQKLNAVLKHMTGGGQDMQMLATLVNDGIAGYEDMLKRMEEQSDLTRRVNLQLGTLKNLWDAASGTFTNALAAFSETFAPELKAMTEWFGRLAEGMFNFTKSHPLLAKWLGLATVGFVTLALVVGGFAIVFAGVLHYVALLATIGPGLAVVIGGIATAFRVLGTVFAFVGRLFLLNPIGLVVTAIAGAAYLIYKNWDTLKSWFTGFFEWIGTKAKALQDMLPEWMREFTPHGLIIGQVAKLAPAQNVMGPSAPAVAGAQRGLDAGGEIKVSVEDNRVSVRSVKTNDPRVNFNVHNGPYMAGAN